MKCRREGRAWERVRRRGVGGAVVLRERRVRSRAFRALRDFLEGAEEGAGGGWEEEEVWVWEEEEDEDWVWV